MNKIIHIYITCIITLCLSGYVTGQETFTVERAIEYALENSNEMKFKDMDIKDAEYTIRETRSIGMPKVDGNLDYSYYFLLPKFPLPDFVTPAVYGILNKEQLIQKPIPKGESSKASFQQPHDLRASIGGRWLLFDGSYLVGLEAAKSYRDLAVKQKDATEEMIRSNVIKAYSSILVTMIKKDFLMDNISNLSSSLEELKVMYDNGFIESLDIDRLELSLDQLQTQVKNIDDLTALSYNLLKFQMGYPMNKEIKIKESMQELLEKFDADEDVSNVTVDPSQRADYAVLEMGETLNQLDIKRVKKSRLPQVSIFTNLSAGLQRKNLFSSDETGLIPTWVAGLKMSVPIYDGGERSAKLQRAKLQLEKTKLQKEQFSTGVQLQVNNAVTRIQNAKRDIENKKRALEKTQMIFDKTKIKFDEGVGSSVEMTQAEASLYRAQSEYSDALYALLESKIDLDIALGRINKTKQ